MLTAKALPRRIYLASSWRNPDQPAVLAALRAAGHEVYDFRNPAPNKNGFAWRDCGAQAAIDQATTIPSYLEAIRSDRAIEGFSFDKAALEWCDTCVLLLPCGRSAHLELGYAAGQGKDSYVLLHENKFEPELMYLLNTAICTEVQQVIDLMAESQPYDAGRWHEESGGSFASPAGHALRLMREVVELCIATGASLDGMYEVLASEMSKAVVRGDIGGDPDAVPGEVADCKILLDVFTHYAKINQHEVARRKMTTLWQRAWEPSSSGALYRPSTAAAVLDAG